MGISMNILVYRKPTHIIRYDASEHGIGGYSLIPQAGHGDLNSQLIVGIKLL